MSRSAIGTLALLAGCRFGFDHTTAQVDASDGGPTSDIADAPVSIDSPDAVLCLAPIGHDEDGDLIDDACDVCPHLADTQTDGDVDGVGDACDVDAATPQRITFFDTYANARPEWNYFSNVAGTTFPGDVMHVAALTQAGGQSLSEIPTRDRFEVAGHTIATDPISAQMTIGVTSATGSGAYYCEIYEDDNQFYLGFTYTTNGSTYTTVGIRNLVGPFVDQDFILSLDHTPPTMTCRAVWRGTTVSVTGSIPLGIPGELLYVGENRIEVDLTSFVRIHTD